ncbi:MAG: hypothetical protein QOI01_1009 [Mycobacterium sp.]|nr:hypothetical protein [Mycobacterium sp.]
MGSGGRDASLDVPDGRPGPDIAQGGDASEVSRPRRSFHLPEHEGAADLLAYPADAGQMRRLTILFADLVDSTRLSTRVEPEIYRMLVGSYRDEVVQNVNRYEGHIGSTKGDGLLAVFGYPTAHEDDVRRAVLAGLAIVREVVRICEISKRQWGIEIAVRVGVHRGHVYLDTAQDDVYGLAANLAARVSGLAPPNSVVISDAVEPLVRRDFDLEEHTPAVVKGVREPIAHYRVLGERLEPEKVQDRPMVGRQRQRGRLREAWAQAGDGTLSTPGIAFVGEPGIGKSRLAGLAVAMAERSGATVLEMNGSAFHSSAGMHPVRTLLERRSGINRLTDQTERLRLLTAEVARRGLDPSAVAALAPVVGIAPEAGYDPLEVEGVKLYHLIAASVQEYLLASLGGGPGLVVAEDVHWFDPSTLEVLGSLLGAADGRLLVVMTARPGAAPDDGWPVKVIKLKALTHKQTDALIVSLNPLLTVGERMAVHHRCDGVPFYVEQLVAGLGGPGVPEALYDPLFARLRASANAVPVVEAAGIIGRNVDRVLLGTVCTLSDAEVNEVIDELERALVFEQQGTDGWRFRHELLREVAVELAPPSVRRGLHARVADALVDTGGDPDWGVVAGHYERADRFGDAAKAYWEASTIARRRGALVEARGYLTRALALLERVAPGTMPNQTETAFRMERGLLFAAADGALSEDAAADFARSVELTEVDRLNEGVLETRLDLVESFVMRADLRGASQLLATLRQDIGIGRSWMQMIVDIWSGVVACLRGTFDSALTQLTAATTRFAAASPDDVEAYALNVLIVQAYTQLASVYLVRGDLASAGTELSRAEQLLQGLGYPEGPFNIAYVRFGQIWLLVEAGDLDRAAGVAADVTALAERHGLDVLQLFGATWQASIRALAAVTNDTPHQPNSLTDPVAAVTDLVDALRAVELNEVVMYFCGIVARAMTAAGQPEQARARLDSALQIAEDTELCFYKSELLRLRGHTQADGEARSADFAAARELARAQGATLFELRAALDECDAGAAHVHVRDVIGRFPQGSDSPEFARARALLDDWLE